VRPQPCFGGTSDVDRYSQTVAMYSLFARPWAGDEYQKAVNEYLLVRKVWEEDLKTAFEDYQDVEIKRIEFIRAVLENYLNSARNMRDNIQQVRATALRSWRHARPSDGMGFDGFPPGEGHTERGGGAAHCGEHFCREGHRTVRQSARHRPKKAHGRQRGPVQVNGAPADPVMQSIICTKVFSILCNASLSCHSA